MSTVTWIKQVQILVLAFGVCTGSVVHAGINQWTKEEEHLGDLLGVSEIVIDPQTPTILYAVAGAQSQKSTDGGESWVLLALPANTAISSLVVDPWNPTTLYASYSQYDPITATDVSTGVLKSSDGGGSWVSVFSFVYYDGACGFDHLAVAPTIPATVYAVCSFGVAPFIMKSSDGGANWTFLDFPPNRGINVVAIDPLTPTTIYVATNSGLFKSVDGGVLWTVPGTVPPPPFAPSTPPYSVPITVLVLDPITPSTVYAGTDYGLFKSVDGGRNWLVTGWSIGVAAVVLDPIHPTTLYAACLPGTWLTCEVDARYSQSLQYYEAGYATIGGISQSTDGGKSWTSINNGFPSDRGVSALAIVPFSDSTLYASVIGLMASGLDPDRVPRGVLEYQVTGPQAANILATMESPEDNQLVSGIGLVRGWAFPTPAGESLVPPALFVDGRLVSNLPCCSERSDVQAAFPQFPPSQTGSSGWGGVFNWGALSSGPHTVQVHFTNFDLRDFNQDNPLPPTVSLVLPAPHTIMVVKPGDFEFLDRFDLAQARASIIGDELVIIGVIVRDKATQQQKQINTRFRWFTNAQSLGMVQSETTSTLASSPSVFSRFVGAVVNLWPGDLTLVANAQVTPGITSYFESPEEEQVVAGLGIIRGWGFPVSSVRFAIDGVSIGTTSCCSYRDDVGNFFHSQSPSGQDPRGYESGWSLQFNYGNLNPGSHLLTVQLEASDGETQTLTRTFTTLRIGGFPFLDQFDLAQASVRIEGDDIVLSGVQVRDKVSQQTKNIEVRARWFQNSQSLGIVASTE